MRALTRKDVTRIANVAYPLHREAERTEALLQKERTDDRAELVMRPVLDQFLRQLLPLYSLERIKELAIEGAVAASPRKQDAADVLGVSLRTIQTHAPGRAA